MAYAVHEEDKEKLLKDGYRQQKTAGFLSEYRFVHSDGAVTWVIGQAVPEINSQNQVIGYEVR